MFLDLGKINFDSSYNVGVVFGNLFRYIALSIMIYYLIIGIILSDKKNITRNLLILFIGNILIYSIFFFTNPNTSVKDFLNNDMLSYFVGYFIFSLVASFIGSKIFHDYRQEINKNGFHRYVFWKFNVQAILTYQVLYYVFVKIVNPLFDKEIFYNAKGNYIVVGIISAIFLTIFYFFDRKKNILETQIAVQSTKAETATANFETLKNQLDPHFLFNSLNVLTGLIEENSDKAIDFTTSLSKIYRYLLEQKDKEVVPLSEEINFAKTYINLLKLRFENSIDFELDVKNVSENEFIIPLALQILLENTIKHNIVSESKPLTIRIYKEGQNLIVENSLQLKSSVKDSTGVGLNNIKNRYQLISNREIRISPENNFFKVELPILTSKYVDKLSVNEEDLEDVKKRVSKIKSFYYAIVIYIVVNLLLIVLNFTTNYGNWWFHWPLIIWGSILVIKSFKVFGFDLEWENRKTQEILEKNKEKSKCN